MNKAAAILVLLSMLLMGGDRLRATPRSLVEVITSFEWSWVNSSSNRKSAETIRFYPGGTARNPKHFTAHWEIKGALTLVLTMKSGKATLTFDPDFSRYEGIDFDGRTRIWGVASAPAAPDDAPSAKAKPAHSTSPSPDSSAAHSVTAGDLIHDHSASLVIIKAENGAGTGFICKTGGSTFLYTNTHVLADLANPQFTRLDGAVVSTGDAGLAVGRDIARFELKDPPDDPLEAVTDLSENVRVGDDVIVLGNSGGGGVVTGIKGVVVGIGPDRIEVSAQFIPGNSGSPIIHAKTGKVIGIATYLTIRHEDPTRQSDTAIHRFGFRIDNAAAWETVDWNAFGRDANSVKQVSILTLDVLRFLAALKARRTPVFLTDALRQPATEWMKALRNPKLTTAGRRTVTETFLRALRTLVAADVLALEPRLRYTYFREAMRAQKLIRSRLYTSFDTDSRNLSSR